MDKIIKAAKKLAEDTQKELTVLMEGKGGVNNKNRRSVLENDKTAKALELASLHAQMIVNHLGKLKEN
jgi:hypothetical protein